MRFSGSFFSIAYGAFLKALAVNPPLVRGYVPKREANAAPSCRIWMNVLVGEIVQDVPD